MMILPQYIQKSKELTKKLGGLASQSPLKCGLRGRFSPHELHGQLLVCEISGIVEIQKHKNLPKIRVGELVSRVINGW